MCIRSTKSEDIYRELWDSRFIPKITTTLVKEESQEKSTLRRRNDELIWGTFIIIKMKYSYRKTNLCSVFFMCWQKPLIDRAYREKDYPQEDLVLMKESDNCEHLVQTLESKWKEEISIAQKKKRAPSVMRAFIKAYGCRFLSFTLIGFIAEIMLPMMIYFMRFMIEFIEKEDPSPYEAVYLLGVFIPVLLIGFLLRHFYLFYAYSFIIIMRKSTTALLYKKLMKLS